MISELLSWMWRLIQMIAGYLLTNSKTYSTKHTNQNLFPFLEKIFHFLSSFYILKYNSRSCKFWYRLYHWQNTQKFQKVYSISEQNEHCHHDTLSTTISFFFTFLHKYACTCTYKWMKRNKVPHPNLTGRHLWLSQPLCFFLLLVCFSYNPCSVNEEGSLVKTHLFCSKPTPKAYLQKPLYTLCFSQLNSILLPEAQFQYSQNLSLYF